MSFEVNIDLDFHLSNNKKYAVVKTQIVETKESGARQYHYVPYYNTEVCEPNWFGRKLLKRTFESKVKNTVAQIVKQANYDVEELQKLRAYQEKMRDVADAILNRTR